LGGAPDKIEFGALHFILKMIFGGKNCNDFPENQQTREYGMDHQDKAILQ